MRPTDKQLERALRAASDAFPPGEMMLYLVVVTPTDKAALISSASNVESIPTRINILTAEIENLKERLT